MKKTATKSKAPLRKKSPVSKEPARQLRLYVAGHTPKSMAALANLKIICEEHLDDYELEVIDLLKQPQLAKGDQIFAIPTLVCKLPKPIKKVIGDLSNTERVLVGLNIREARKKE